MWHNKNIFVYSGHKSLYLLWYTKKNSSIIIYGIISYDQEIYLSVWLEALYAWDFLTLSFMISAVKEIQKGSTPGQVTSHS